MLLAALNNPSKIQILLNYPKSQIVSFYYFQDARDDIGGAQAIGMKGILVQTGR